MPETAFGLPLHPLIVHGTVVIVPLAAVTVLLAVLWPRFRRWAGPLPAGLAVVGLVLVPLSTSSGENLERSVAETRLVERHAELGDQLLPFVAVLAVAAIGLWWAGRRERVASSWPKAVVAVLVVLAVLGSIGVAVQVVRIGHSGAEAAWSDVGTS
ncbi:DUF2231 domain-containing protein [Aeromicrobium sp.]|uniref:DUF2231 domain-containing protein n=1 Tax=Aeromicrobium sp. TaxID=1871063 RepID=UPI0025C02F07|nr:DUF2231 domain-containing protein [Aeromicrobium sp.]MCK5891617.1 hypothetical protein [Aeromicrobium sp.]